MLRLAVDVGAIDRLYLSTSVQVVLHAVPATVLVLEFGDDVLLYGRNDDGRTMYCAKAQFIDAKVGQDASGAIVNLDRLEWFGHHVERSSSQAPEDDWEELGGRAFDVILSDGLSRALAGMEAATLFIPSQSIALEMYADISAKVSANFGFRCVATSLSASEAQLNVTPIKLSHFGGSVHVSNFLLLSETAATAFSQFHLTIGPGMEIIVNLSLIDPELLEHLNPLGRLSVPDEALSRPDTESLAWHRQQFFARLG